MTISRKGTTPSRCAFSKLWVVGIAFVVRIFGQQQGPTLAELNLNICSERVMASASKCDLYEFTRFIIILERFDCIDASYRGEPVIHTLMDYASAGNKDCRTIVSNVLDTQQIVGHMNYTSAFAQRQNLLHKAAQANFVEIVDRLIAQHADPTFTDARKRTALHLAAQTGNANLLKTIYDLEPLMANELDIEGKIPAMTCVKMTSVPDPDVTNRRHVTYFGPSCEYITLKSQVMAKDTKGNTMMHWCAGPVSLCQAIATQQWTMVDNLGWNQTAKQYFFTTRNDDGRLPIHTIAGFSQADRVLYWLADNPFTVGNRTHPDGVTEIHPATYFMNKINPPAAAATGDSGAAAANGDSAGAGLSGGTATTDAPTTAAPVVYPWGDQPLQFLYFMAAYVNQTDVPTQLWLPIHYSARYGITENVVALLICGTRNTDAKDINDRNPLEISMIHGQLHLVPVFMGLTTSAENTQENLDNMYLTAAMSVGSVEILRMLLDQWKLNADSRDADHGRTALYTATLAENLAFMDILAAYNASTTFHDKYGMSMLYGLIMNNEKKILKKATIERLFSLGLDPNVRNKDEKGYTVTHLAAEINHLQTLEIVLDQPNVNVNMRTVDDRGFTPLFLAASKAAVELLLTKNKRRLEGEEESLMQQGFMRLPKPISSENRRIQALRGTGSALSAWSEAKEEKGIVTMQQSRLETVPSEHRLLKGKVPDNVADPLIRTLDHKRQLVIHVNTKDPDGLHFMLANGLRDHVDDRDAEWDTPLMRAALRNDYEATRVFLKWCANPNARNRDFRKAIDYATAGSMVQKELQELEAIKDRIDRERAAIWSPTKLKTYGLYTTTEAPVTKLKEGEVPELPNGGLYRTKDYPADFEYKSSSTDGGLTAAEEQAKPILTSAEDYNYIDHDLNIQTCECDCGKPFASTIKHDGHMYFYDFRSGCTGRVGCKVAESEDAFLDVQCKDGAWMDGTQGILNREGAAPQCSNSKQLASAIQLVFLTGLLNVLGAVT